MMQLDESMKLQDEQQQHIKEERLKRQMETLGLGAVVGGSKRRSIPESIADDLSLNMERMKLNPELGPHRPQDDDSDEYEEDSEDEYSLGENFYDDDEGFEEDDSYIGHC
ncbi:hypothetical protein BX666DRAFT_1357399 [Dichotomocladium elegans]|nr:hypothetical protein BX666DRAFT_1357399 [Dichotomocladium elegans]